MIKVVKLLRKLNIYCAATNEEQKEVQLYLKVSIIIKWNDFGG